MEIKQSKDELKQRRKEKGRNSVQRIIYGRTLMIALLVFLQIFVLFIAYKYLSENVEVAYSTYVLSALIVVLIMINRGSNPNIQLSWGIIIALVPILGGLFYLYAEMQLINTKAKRSLNRIYKDTISMVTQNENAVNDLYKANPGDANLAKYLFKYGRYSVEYAKEVTYYPSGEENFKDILKALESAEKFIFLEYFIIKEGHMWGSILKILKKKAQEGVDVRLIYDGMNTLANLPYSYPKDLRKQGIKCKEFGHIRPLFSTSYNYRDHRKILVVDNKVAFTGGINFADEYINKTHPFGYWKDTGIRITGEGVYSFTLMFLQVWNASEKGKNYDLYKYIPQTPHEKRSTYRLGRYVIPYSDGPLEKENMAKTIYLDMINRAEHTLEIMTPYLILDYEMKMALLYAAKRGVNVTLVLPHVPDKKYAFALAQNHYEELLNAGVRLYEFAPGFVHAKVCIADGRRATVGSVNFDYRSLYLNFECGVLLIDCAEIKNISEDVAKTAYRSMLITRENYKKHRFWLRLMGKLLKPFAPLF